MTRRSAILVVVCMLFATISGSIGSILYRRKWKPINLKKYIDTLTEIAEIIIPETFTPGAKRAGVMPYIITAIELNLTPFNKRTLLLGLEDLENRCYDRYSLSFSHCSVEQKIAALRHFEAKSNFNNIFLNKIKHKLIGPSFFELVKDLTVTAYCTSKIGATQGLAYDHVPVDYVACTPLMRGQRSWATS